MIVELACSATLIPAYYPELFNRLIPSRADDQPRNVIFIVCGGFVVSLRSMLRYQQAVDAQLQSSAIWDVWCNGELWNIPEEL